VRVPANLSGAMSTRMHGTVAVGGGPPPTRVT
jgi:hypothetical protein